MKPTATQKTTHVNPKEMEQKWFLIDVKGKHVGHAATQIAKLLRGKDKVHYTSQHDCGDHIVVINAKHIELSGNKLDNKMYEWHTQFPGGFRSRSAKEMMERKPEKILYEAVYGMLPKNRLRSKMIKKLHLSADETHSHEAQKPQVLALK